MGDGISMGKRSYDIAVIGAGIVGCAVARELSKRFDKILLIEKEKAVGLHTSGRNSGVVHSGFNPAPGTLKARLCVEGNIAVREYCQENKVPCEQVGTYVAATREEELPILEALRSRGLQNGVPGLEVISGDSMREREPNVRAQAALYSPTGAIVDSGKLTSSLAQDAKKRGAALALGQEVMQIQERTAEVSIHTRDDVYSAQLVVNCGGLHADRLAHLMGVGRDYIIAPFRGEYFVIDNHGDPIIRSMVYPVPHPLVPFLGIHLTRTIDNSVLIGPNAVPAFGREAYGRWAFNVRDLGQILSHKGIWNALVRNRALVKAAWNELRHSCSRRHFLKEADRLVTGLRLKDLKLGSRVGIRPQLIKSDGHLVEDLVVEATPRSIHILNVVSPGMTSAIPFAKWLSSGIDDKLQWAGLKASR